MASSHLNGERLKRAHRMDKRSPKLVVAATHRYTLREQPEGTGRVVVGVRLGTLACIDEQQSTVRLQWCEKGARQRCEVRQVG